MPITNKKWGLVLFFAVFILTLFLSGNDIFEKFDTRTAIVKYNFRLLALFAFSDIIQIIANFTLAGLLFRLYFAHKDDANIYKNLYWQFAGCFFCFGLRSLFIVLSFFQNYLWIHGIISLAIAWYSCMVCYSFIRIYNYLLHPRTPEQLAEAIELKKKVIELYSKYE